jgi:hypothetical protein
MLEAGRLQASRHTSEGGAMLGWPVQSALFIDYENVGHRILPDTIPHWVEWLERGEFDTRRRRRRFLHKRVYWNLSADHHRGTFAQFGFDPVLCERFAGLRNSADITMTIDIIETTLRNPKINEYILVTRDSDFVPVLRRLRQEKKRTAILVDQDNAARFRIFRTHADIVIPMQEFLKATTYVRPTRREAIGRALTAWRDGVRRRVVSRGAAEPAAADAPRQAAAAAATEDTQIASAVDHVVRTASLQPNQATAQRKIEKELAKIRGFSRTGPRRYFGKGTYRRLMEEVARRTDCIKVTNAVGGGISVSYVPKDDERKPRRLKRRRMRRKGPPRA